MKKKKPFKKLSLSEIDELNDVEANRYEKALYENEEEKRLNKLFESKSSNPFVIKFAKAVLIGMYIREQSFDKVKAEKASKKSQYVDFRDFYTKDKLQSIAEACRLVKLPEELSYEIYLAFHWWNDIQEWAKAMLGIKVDEWQSIIETYIEEEKEK